MSRPMDNIADAIEVGSSETRSDLLGKTLASMRSAAPRAPSTIYKVPEEIKGEGNEGGYEPVAVCIGPFTKKKKSTAELEKYKWCCMQQLMTSYPENHDSAKLLKSCLDSMKLLEPKIKESYSEAIDLSTDDLALNMVLDGCFILHCLLEKKAAQKDDQKQAFGRVRVWHLVRTDLLLLENQIPFFVLSKLFELLCGSDDEPKDTLVKCSLRLFRSLCPHMLQRSATNSEIHYRGVPVHHLLHLFYLSVAVPGQMLPSNDVQSDDIQDSRHQAADGLVVDLPQWIPCAKELEEAGVKFRKRKEAESFLDIKFDSHKGILEIPPLELYDFSTQLFRNLIAFEQTHPDTRCDFSIYASFMDCLINTPEDMRILHLRGILVNRINGKHDASRFFSRICVQVAWSEAQNRLIDVMASVNVYSDSRLHKWRAALVRNYFSNPWVTMSVLAAVLLLAMTILQTTFTVYPYFNPPK